MKTTPSTMATQHPDNADQYITIQAEPEEAIIACLDQERGGLGIEEVMIDFEGKMTPYHQTSQVAMGLIQKELKLGRDAFITPRIPNAKKEPVFRQLMSIMSLVETNILCFDANKGQSIFETIVPMIEDGEEMLQIQERINSVIELGNKNYPIQFDPYTIRLIPLIESVPALLQVDQILRTYLSKLKDKQVMPERLRVMFARSDSAMSYGMMSSVLSVIVAIHKTQVIAEEIGIEISPILGCGALPFRGHLDLKNVDRILETYGGIRTFTIQSGIRYDHGANETKKLVNRLNVEASLTESRTFTMEQIKQLQEMIAIFTKHYMTTFVELISPLEEITKLIPRNRDRLASSRTGLEYVREIAHMDEIAALTDCEILKAELLAIDTDVHCSVPRAISFTAALYTVGMPPEFIGVGRGLHEIVQRYGQEGLQFLLQVYPQLKHDLNFALKYMNQKVSRGIFDDRIRDAYQKDVAYAIEYLHLKEPDDAYREDAFYHTLLKAIRPILLHTLGKQKDLFDDHEEEMKILKEWIVKLGKLRGSLG